MTTKRHFYVTEITDCDKCAGSGTHFDGDAFVPCDKCDGTGSMCTNVSLADALMALGVMDVIDRANNAAKRAAYEAGCLANGMLPD